jgi:hypothetical protein
LLHCYIGFHGRPWFWKFYTSSLALLCKELLLMDSSGLRNCSTLFIFKGVLSWSRIQIVRYSNIGRNFHQREWCLLCLIISVYGKYFANDDLSTSVNFSKIFIPMRCFMTSKL